MSRTAAPSLRAGLAAAACLLLAAAHAQNGNIAINATGAAADPNALLDISSTTRGLLIPRMASLPAVTAPDGLTVYRTAPTDARGFYVLHGGSWNRLENGPNAWDLDGNTLGATGYPNPDFIGTTDSRPLYFRTNNLHRMRIEAGTGFLGVGYPAATAALERLDIYGALQLNYYHFDAPQISNTNAPGVIRYQTYGTNAGSAPYIRGSHELMATGPTDASAVLGATNAYPLQYAAHWGNVADSAMRPGRNGPGPVLQPMRYGWRALENPYEEVRDLDWSHHREAVCTPVGSTSTSAIPSGIATVASSTLPVAEANVVTPFYLGLPSPPAPASVRRQYLFLASELNLELAQISGNAAATEGLCPGAKITKISFSLSSAGSGRPIAAPFVNNGTITVRNAPAGLNALTIFDNTAGDTATMGCGNLRNDATLWPAFTGAGDEEIPLNNHPFIWDGSSNVIIEVAYRVNIPVQATRPVLCTDAGFPSSYGAQLTGIPTAAMLLPYADWGCDPANVQSRMKDAASVTPPNANYTSGGSNYRPQVKFHGVVAQAGPGFTAPPPQNSRIQYSGALMLEEPVPNNQALPWSSRRPGHPAGQDQYSYKGDGTISAQHGVFDNTVVLNDHVFDRAFDGRVHPEDAARAGGERLLSIPEMEAFTRANRHLPTMKGREAWRQEGGFSLGDLTNQLWTTAEAHALYVTCLNDKLNVLEMLTNDRPISRDEFQLARTDLGALPDRTDAEKALLIESLRQRTPQPPTPR